jgi:N-acetylglucosamine kinase-like BadF-type ATPase
MPIGKDHDDPKNGHSMTYVLGVDGGGSKTHAVVADDHGEVLGMSVRGPSNWEEIGLARAADTLERAVTAAVSDAGISPQDLSASVFGIAGVDWESDQIRLGTILTPLQLGGTREIVNDAFIALRAGTRRSWGLVVVAGTGSVVAGRNQHGRTFRTLGLGPYFGDYGGGSDISESAVLAVSEAYLGKGPATALTEVLCTHARVRSVPELLELMAREQDDLPYIAQEVVEVAGTGDEVARLIVEHAGRELGRNAALVATRLDMAGTAFEVVLSGGMFQAAGSLLTNPLLAVVRGSMAGATPVHLAVPPVMGALAMALERIDVRVDDEVSGRLRDGMTGPLVAVPAKRL